MIDTNTLALIVALLVNVPTWYMLRENRKKTAAESREREASSAKLEDEITDRVLARANIEIATLTKQLETLRMELQNERAARGLLEVKLIEAGQRISALEDELDKRERRIKELESNSGTFPAAKPHGFRQ